MTGTMALKSNNTSDLVKCNSITFLSTILELWDTNIIPRQKWVTLDSVCPFYSAFVKFCSFSSERRIAQDERGHVGGPPRGCHLSERRPQESVLQKCVSTPLRAPCRNLSQLVLLERVQRFKKEQTFLLVTKSRSGGEGWEGEEEIFFYCLS